MPRSKQLNFARQRLTLRSPVWGRSVSAHHDCFHCRQHPGDQMVNGRDL